MIWVLHTSPIKLVFLMTRLPLPVHPGRETPIRILSRAAVPPAPGPAAAGAPAAAPAEESFPPPHDALDPEVKRVLRAGHAEALKGWPGLTLAFFLNDWQIQGLLAIATEIFTRCKLLAPL